MDALLPDLTSLPSLPLAGRLHAAVSRLIREAGGRRHLPASCWVGVPGSEHVAAAICVEDADCYDASLRADLIDHALSRLAGLDPALVNIWITRSGPLTVTDPDLSWHAAARIAFGRHGRAWPGFYAVTRHGWIDVESEEAVSWSRFRAR